MFVYRIMITKLHSGNRPIYSPVCMSLVIKHILYTITILPHLWSYIKTGSNKMAWMKIYGQKLVLVSKAFYEWCIITRLDTTHYQCGIHFSVFVSFAGIIVVATVPVFQRYICVWRTVCIYNVVVCLCVLYINCISPCYVQSQQ